jgi:hypothetical protein
MGAAPSYLDAIGALQGHDSTFIVEERNKNLTVGMIAHAHTTTAHAHMALHS